MMAIDFFNIGAFYLQWWGLSLIIVGFILTVLLGCVMIVGMIKWLWRLTFPRKYYEPKYYD